MPPVSVPWRANCSRERPPKSIDSTSCDGFSDVVSTGFSDAFFPMMLFRTSSGSLTSIRCCRDCAGLEALPLGDDRAVPGSDVVESSGVSNRDVDDERGWRDERRLWVLGRRPGLRAGEKDRLFGGGGVPAGDE